MMKQLLSLLCALFVLPVSASTVVLYQDRQVTLEAVLSAPTDLWIAPADLTRVNDFVLKPEGACLDDICVPVRQNEDSNIFVTRADQSWFNVSELARRLKQATVYDHESSTWSFGEVPATRNAFVNNGLAPDFELNDRNGKPIKLSAYKDKKVILLTWASW